MRGQVRRNGNHPETLNQYYEENKDDIDTVDYRAFSFTFAVSATATEAEKRAGQTAAKEKADAFYADAKSEVDFRKLALEAVEEAKRDDMRRRTAA